MTSHQPLRHVMLDLETFATSPDAAIISIGACLFDPDQNYVPTGHDDTSEPGSQKFYQVIDLAGSGDTVRGTIDPATVLWWLQQSDEARASLFAPAKPTETLGAALLYFTKWLESHGLTPANKRSWSLWANDPDFDVSILTSAYRRYGIPFPLSYGASRSMRTVCRQAKKYDLLPNRNIVDPNTNKHDALADALYQARVVTAITQEMNKRMAWRELPTPTPSFRPPMAPNGRDHLDRPDVGVFRD